MVKRREQGESPVTFSPDAGAGVSQAPINPATFFVTRIDQYILRQMTTPLVFGTIVITLVVWLTQTLQRLELVIEHGEGWGAFLWLTLLLIPSLLIVVIPFAVFGAALFTLQRLHADSEIAVLFAAGYSKMRLATPMLFIAFLGAAATLWINLDLMPRTYRELKQQIAEIRADYASLILRSGEFTTFGDGFTIYIEETLQDGIFRGMIVNDYRGNDGEKTYMAQYGQLRDGDAGPILYLSNGNIQTIDEEKGGVEFIEFEQTAINIGAFQKETTNVQLEMTERYLGELLRPDMSNQWDAKNAGRLKAEGHARLASPFYPIAYVLLAIYGLLGGQYSRRGYMLRIAIVSAAVGGLRILAFVAQSAAAETGAYWLLYVLPIIPALALMLLLADVGRGGLKKLTPRRRRRARLAVAGG